MCSPDKEWLIERAACRNDASRLMNGWTQEGRVKGGPLDGREGKGLGESSESRVGRQAHIAFEQADIGRAVACTGRQLFLSQARGAPVAFEQRPKGHGLDGGHRARHLSWARIAQRGRGAANQGTSSIPALSNPVFSSR